MSSLSQSDVEAILKTLISKNGSNSSSSSSEVDKLIHTWHGSVRPRVDELIALGNSTVQVATEIVYRTIPSYASLALVFATGWVVAIALSICVSCWMCSRRRMRNQTTRAAAESNSPLQVVESAVPLHAYHGSDADVDAEQQQLQPTAPPRYLFDPSGTRRQQHVQQRLYPI
jgi:hypothetical protein